MAIHLPRPSFNKLCTEGTARLLSTLRRRAGPSMMNSVAQRNYSSHSSLLSLSSLSPTSSFQLRSLRPFSSPSSGSGNSFEVFDRQLKQRHRIKAALNITHEDGADYFEYLRKEAGDRLIDRLDDISRTFPLALELGSHRGYLYSLISDREHYSGKGGVGGVQTLYECDMSKAPGQFQKYLVCEDRKLVERKHFVVNEEFLPFKDNTFDLVVSNLSLHWANDLPGTLTGILKVLKPDGVFVGCLLGGNTLQELKYCIYIAEQERRGRISPRVSPMTLPSDVAALMQSCNFAMPTIDVDTFTISYPDAFTLMEHVAAMGEGNAGLHRSLHVGKDTLLAAAAMYQDMFSTKQDDGSILATFQVIYMIGWHPHESQAKACRRGSAKKSFKELASDGATASNLDASSKPN